MFDNSDRGTENQVLIGINEINRGKTLAEVEQTIVTFQSLFEKSAIPPLKIDRTCSIQVALRNLDKKVCGVYFLMDANFLVHYAGKASLRSSIKERLGKHYHPDGTARDRCAVGTTYVATVRFNWQHSFLAAALEEFLITRLGFPRNKQGFISCMSNYCGLPEGDSELAR